MKGCLPDFIVTILSGYRPCQVVSSTHRKLQIQSDTTTPLKISNSTEISNKQNEKLKRNSGIKINKNKENNYK